jgi:DNA-binding NarL/FixJ family response regulator
MVRVLVVDDHAAVRASLAAFLDIDPALEVVAEAGDGRQAVELAALLKPDLVLMDVRMPVLDGIEATRRLKAARPKTRVVLISAYEEDELREAGLSAGAEAFLLKGIRGAEIAARVREVACAR